MRFLHAGMVLTSQALLNENPSPTEDEIRDYLRGNHCRCTGYTAIVEAIQAVAVENKEAAARLEKSEEKLLME